MGSYYPNPITREGYPMAPKVAKKPVDNVKTSEIHAGRILNLFYHAAFDDMDSNAVTPAPTVNANLKHFQTYENLCKPEEEYMDWHSRVTIAPEVKQIIVGLYNDVIEAISDIGGISETDDDMNTFIEAISDMVDRHIWTLFTAVDHYEPKFGPRLRDASDPKRWFSGRFNSDVKTNNQVLLAKISRTFTNVMKSMAFNAVIYTHYCNMSWNVGLSKAFFVSNSFDVAMMSTVDGYIRERVKKPAAKKASSAATTDGTASATVSDDAIAALLADSPAGTATSADVSADTAMATTTATTTAAATAAATATSGEIDDILKSVLTQ